MPLFVPLLRLLMLFLNVYDSYKTLKEPLPSSRNGGRPSVRAMSQRKRDMKGCLAVWIVWASLMMYERTLESIIYLFIPFYDEFKSLILLFLIFTRAKGAEPIYLHVIRPFVKPYTQTLDGTLDLMLMIGDFVFALSTYPIRLALEWYRKRFGGKDDIYETDQDTPLSESSSNNVNTSEVPTSFIASSAVLPANDISQRPSESSKASKSVNMSSGPPSRRPSAYTPSSSQNPSGKSGDPPAGFEPNFFKSPVRKNTQVSTQRQSSSGSITKSSHSRKEPEAGSSRHQIWHPPPSAYLDDDKHPKPDSTVRPTELDQAALALEHQLLEEWRQYPAFPSAYPPTPVAVTTSLEQPHSLASPSTYPTITEEPGEQGNSTIQQDFARSLLPPREPLDPNHVGDLSDRPNFFGITSSSSPSEVEDADDSMSTSDDDYEDEDDFNITLRTPLQPRGSLRSHVQAQRFVPLTATLSSASSASIPSRSSALTTTIDNRSTAPIGSSSDSSLSPSKPNTTSLSVIGKKRAYPRSSKSQVKNRVRQMEGLSESSQEVSDSESNENRELETTLKPLERESSSSSVANTSKEKSSATSSGTNDHNMEEGERIPPEEKRRKIVRSVPPRAVKSSHTTRPRIPRHTSPPRKGQPSKVKPRPLPNRSSTAQTVKANAAGHQLLGSGRVNNKSSKVSSTKVDSSTAVHSSDPSSISDHYRQSANTMSHRSDKPIMGGKAA